MTVDTNRFVVHGAGLGLKRALMDPLEDAPAPQIDFFEVAPENWIGIGGRFGKQFRRFTERYPFVCHGLSLSLGGPDPLDENFLKDVKQFLEEHGIRLYSEHLSYCSNEGHMYDLMPIPFTADAVHYVADRIKRTQDILEQKIAIENVSYYAAPSQELSEVEFIQAVLDEADCLLHLDVNNIYVNSVNHRYSAEDYLDAMPGERLAYLHVAGHYVEAEDLLVDTHGADVIDPVWALLERTYERFGIVPTLLERDFNIPPLAELLKEVDTIAAYQKKWAAIEKQNDRAVG
jgi:uncharacterized protein (UPF0276 family)